MQDRLIPFLLRHCLAGVLAGWVMLAGLLAIDLGGLRSLILASDVGALALGMLLAGFAITFGSVAMGAAVIGLGRVGTKPGGHLAQAPRLDRARPRL